MKRTIFTILQLAAVIGALVFVTGCTNELYYPFRMAKDAKDNEQDCFNIYNLIYA